MLSVLPPMYRLTARGGVGLACDDRGIALGPVPLIEALAAGGRHVFRPRPAEEIARTLALAYGPFAPQDLTRCLSALDVAARALEAGDLVKASVAAVLLKLPDLTPEAFAKLAGDPSLKKSGPDRPSDANGCSDRGGGSGATMTHHQGALAAGAKPVQAANARGGADASTSKGGINWPKIGELEGNKLDGYVPAKNGVPLGSSGVTIGMGVDLGQMNHMVLDALDVPPSAKDKLRPYLGLKGTDAQAKLESDPLRLSRGEVDKLNTAVQEEQMKLLREKYDAAVGPNGTKFDDLPEEAQTVIASVKFQHGNIWASGNAEVKKFWKAATDKDWVEMQSALRSWTPRTYETRRNKEADYLAPIAVAMDEERPAAPAGESTMASRVG